jgi:hypothetical protein
MLSFSCWFWIAAKELIDVEAADESCDASEFLLVCFLEIKLGLYVLVAIRIGCLVNALEVLGLGSS